jgi:ABC-2 type transport system ATP-binding protein
VTTDEVAIRLERLTKLYAGRAVVDGLDLAVRRGEILALLGPNGAGKTTTVEIVEGYRAPDEGTVRVLGLDPRRDGSRLKPRMGLMLQSGGLYNQLQPLEALELFAAFYPSPMEPAGLLRQVGLERVARSRYRTLSGGERQRLSLALALVGRPELAILDEPTAAMDVTARRATWDMLRELRAGGSTVLMTTHMLDEAEELADRVAIIHHGRLIALGAPADLRRGVADAATGRREVRLDLAAPLDDPHLEGLRRLTHAAGVRGSASGRYAIATDAPGELLVELGPWLLAVGIEPLAIHLGQASLEDVVVRLMEESGAGHRDDWTDETAHASGGTPGPTGGPGGSGESGTSAAGQDASGEGPGAGGTSPTGPTASGERPAGASGAAP